MKANPIRAYLQSQKKSYLPIFLIAGACVLIGFVVLPQFSSLNTLQGQISQKNDHIKTLQDSLNLLSQQSDDTLNDNFTTIDSALPNTKRVVSIFNTLADASTKAGVTMSSFEVKVGNVYAKGNKDTGNPQLEQSTVRGVPYLSVVTEVNADNARNIVQFIDALSTLFPLSEVQTTDITSTSGNIEIRFFYKPYNLDKLAHQEALQPLNSTEQKTLNEIKGWEQN